MAFKFEGDGAYKSTKKYLFQILDGGPLRHFVYVTADTALTVEACGYITTATEPGLRAYNMLREGDIVWIYTVLAISDSRAIWQDIEAGLAGLQAVVVIRKDSDVLEFSAALFGTTSVSYTS